MNVWLLTIGEYSAYQVLAIFDDAHRAAGERTAALIGGELEGHDDDEPFVLNQFDIDEPPTGKEFHQLEMGRSGEIYSHYKNPPLDDEGKKRHEKYRLDSHETRGNIAREYTRKSVWRLHVRMYAKNMEHIVKVANEIRMQILARTKPATGDLP